MDKLDYIFFKNINKKNFCGTFFESNNFIFFCLIYAKFNFKIKLYKKKIFF